MENRGKKNIQFNKIPSLKLIEQKVEMEQVYPEAQAYIKDGVLTWIGIVKPTPFSKDYVIMIEYKIGKSPKTWLINETLDTETYEQIPHNYEVDLFSGKIRLCLYKPGRKEWQPNSSIAKTIIPWAIEWLFYYEVWQVTGEWLGGGEHPSI